MKTLLILIVAFAVNASTDSLNTDYLVHSQLVYSMRQDASRALREGLEQFLRDNAQDTIVTFKQKESK
jgi:hypothetical protein